MLNMKWINFGKASTSRSLFLVVVALAATEVTNGKQTLGKSRPKSDLIPIPDHLKNDFNRHLVEELDSGDLDYDEYIDLELEKHDQGERNYESFLTSFRYCNWLVLLLILDTISKQPN